MALPEHDEQVIGFHKGFHADPCPSWSLSSAERDSIANEEPSSQARRLPPGRQLQRQWGPPSALPHGRMGSPITRPMSLDGALAGGRL